MRHGKLWSSPHLPTHHPPSCPPTTLLLQESFKTEDDGWVIRDGVVVVIKDSNIPDGTVI